MVESRIATMLHTMTPDSVLEYLCEHPEFFEHHAATIADLTIPHPHSGRAISINERQLIALRERNRKLEQQIEQWLTIGRDNDRRGDCLQELALAALQTAPRAERLAAMCLALEQGLAVPAVRLLRGLDHDAWSAVLGDPALPRCGPLEERSVAAKVSSACGLDVASAAWVPVADGDRISLLLLASDDPERFSAAAGTLYLERAGALFAAVLAQPES